MLSTRLVALAAAGLGALSLAAPAAAAAPAEQHCVVDVIGQEADGELELSKPECFRSTRPGDEPGRRPGRSPPRHRRPRWRWRASSPCTTTGANFTGSTLTVNGTTCGGGYTNLVIAWRNRISSSLNGCSVVRFYDGLNKTGQVETQFGSGNLGALNNRADSVQYG